MFTLNLIETFKIIINHVKHTRNTNFHFHLLTISTFQQIVILWMNYDIISFFFISTIFLNVSRKSSSLTCLLKCRLLTLILISGVF